jgi:hypothetical protein
MKVIFELIPFGVFFSVYSGMKECLCHRTVFSQTQKIKNICLKRRFQFVGRRLQIENPCPFARKELAYFSLHSKRLTLSFALSPAHALLKRRKKDAKWNDYLPSSSIITKLANGLKRWQSLKYPPHAKDYAIKPLRYLLRFLLRSFSPYGWFPFKA